MGSGSPTVIFDSGWEDWSPAWSTVQPQIANWTRACSSEYIQFDDPDTVINAVHDVYDQDKKTIAAENVRGAQRGPEGTSCWPMSEC